MSKFIVTRSKKNKEFYFSLVARNGKKIGLEGYGRKAGVLKAIRAIKKAADAPVEFRD